MTARVVISSGTRWEPLVGYARAVRVGRLVFVSRTTATGADGAIVGDDPGAQTRQALANIAAALERNGASLADVVRTRIYVADIEDWPAVGAAHAEAFAAIRPACTMVEVSRFIDPAMRVEIEADAVLAERDPA